MRRWVVKSLNNSPLSGVYISKVFCQESKTSVILHVEIIPPLLALATLGEVTQIEMIPFVSCHLRGKGK